MQVNLTGSGLLKLFRQVGHLARRGSDQQLALGKLTEALGWYFGLDRCMALLVNPDSQELELVADFAREPLTPLGAKRYHLRLNSEWQQLLAEGKPLPLKDIRPDRGEPSAMPELDQFVNDSGSQSMVCFPLVHPGQLLGCLLMAHCRETRGFSDEFLELGEAIAEELATGIVQSRSTREREMESLVFRELQVPILVVGAESDRIKQANRAALTMLSNRERQLAGLNFLDLMPHSDGRRFKTAVESLASARSAARLDGLVLSMADGGTTTVDSCLTSMSGDLERNVVVILVPRSPGLHAGGEEPDAANSKVEELVAKLSKQLYWERIAHHITTAVSSTLDRDAILQLAVDSLGRALGVSRGLIVRTEGPASPMVTHEFALPDISPLGLGRTSQFPASAVSCFRSRCGGFADLLQAAKPPELSQADLRQLLDGGVAAMAGCPISHHGQHHGLIIVVQHDKPRQWTAEELTLMETVADQVAIALGHAHSFGQLKDQLFNINLIGNLTQQLTNVLDLASRARAPEEAAEPDKPAGAVPPLSVRELEVLKLIASGLANREIAQRLFLTESTVELHASRIRKKLKLKSRTALVKYACDNNLV